MNGNCHPAPARSLISHARIVRAALKIVDRDGLNALSIRRVASQLGVSPMSLYYYVPTKDAILDDVYDLVIAKAELGCCRMHAGSPGPRSSGPNCFSTVMAASGVDNAEPCGCSGSLWSSGSLRRPDPTGTMPHPARSWFGALRTDWCSTLPSHTAGFSLKPSQGWMSPNKVLIVAECEGSSRETGRRLERYTALA